MRTTFNEVNGVLPTEQTVDMVRGWFWPTDVVAMECVPEDGSPVMTITAKNSDVIGISKQDLNTYGSVYFYPDPAKKVERPAMSYKHEPRGINGFWADFRWSDSLEALLDYMPLDPTHIIEHPTGYTFMWKIEYALDNRYRGLEELWIRTLAEVSMRPFDIGTPQVVPMPGTGNARLLETEVKSYPLENFYYFMGLGEEGYPVEELEKTAF